MNFISRDETRIYVVQDSLRITVWHIDQRDEREPIAIHRAPAAVCIHLPSFRLVVRVHFVVVVIIIVGSSIHRFASFRSASAISIS